MNLQIVWRNPAMPERAKSRLERLVKDEFGGVYAIRGANETRVFELLPGSAACLRDVSSMSAVAIEVNGVILEKLTADINESAAPEPTLIWLAKLEAGLSVQQ